MRRIHFFVLVGGLLLAAGCRKNPIERLTNPYANAQVPGVSGTFTIYDDELKTGGAVGFIPSGENQSMDFQDTSSPRRTARQIRYSWTGGDTTGNTPGTTQHAFAGFSLFQAPTVAQVATSTGTDLTFAGYTKMTFWIRGSLSEGNIVRIEGPGDTVSTPARLELADSDINGGWVFESISIPPGDFRNVKVFITVSIQYAQPPRTTAAGNGGTVYLDDVRYEQ